MSWPPVLSPQIRTRGRSPLSVVSSQSSPTLWVVSPSRAELDASFTWSGGGPVRPSTGGGLLAKRGGCFGSGRKVAVCGSSAHHRSFGSPFGGATEYRLRTGYPSSFHASSLSRRSSDRVSFRPG